MTVPANLQEGGAGSKKSKTTTTIHQFFPAAKDPALAEPLPSNE